MRALKLALYGVFGISVLFGCSDKKPAETTNDSLARSKGVALNGLDSIQAAKMVEEFRKNPISSNTTTSFWFNERYLDAIISVLEYEGADGIRFYFAKDSIGQNALVMVSTKDNGPRKSPPNSGKNIHKDYFSHATAQLQAPYAKYLAEYGKYEGENLYHITNRPAACVPTIHYVPLDTAEMWAKKFRDDQNDGLKPLTTLSVWYDLKLFTDLKSYLIAAKYKGLNPDGFRIYFIKKPKNTQRKEDVISLVFVPTISKGKENVHEDYYDCFAYEKKLFEVSDNGEECPTFCGEGTTWDTLTVKKVQLKQ